MESSAVVASARTCAIAAASADLGVKFAGSLLRGDGGFAVALVLALLLMEAEREPALLLGIQQTGEFRCTALA